MRRILAAIILLGLAVASAVAAQQVGVRGFDRPVGRAVGCAQPVLAMMDEATLDRFATSYMCEGCHGNWPEATAMRDEKQRSVAPFTLWQASMMANSARDPLFRAVLSAEMLATPSRAAQIEGECMRCHAPMAYNHARQKSLELPSLDTFYGDNEFSLLALDGVSCTVCHQIMPDGLGTPASWSGNQRMADGTKIFGPHKNPLIGPMRNVTGYTPTYGEHMRQSSLCGTCHTFLVDTYTPTGAIAKARFPEQTPYLEWRNSVFSTEVAKPGPEARSCQDCHMPTVSEDGKTIKTRIARTPGGTDFRQIPEREPFGRHIFVGANTLIPQIFIENDAVLNPVARPEDFERQIDLTRAFLSESTARLKVNDLKRDGARITFSVQVENLTGHKFPTAYPSRRAWLRVRVKDAAGNVVWGSGVVDSRGRLLDKDGNPLPGELRGGPILEHRRKVDKAGDVQVWEAILADTQGKPTFRLLRAAAYAKDNRILPKGWKDDFADMEMVKPTGVAGDADFKGGFDTTEFFCDIGAAKGPFTVDIELLYQTLSPRYADELFAYNTREVREFEGYYDKTNKWPERVQRTVQKLD